MTTAEKITELKTLITETHKHGLEIIGEIQSLEKHRPVAWRFKVWQLHGLLDGLKTLNHHRYIELGHLEHPAPAPAQGPFTMFDATNVANIPAGAIAVAGYVDGWWPTWHEVLARFPHAKHLSITVLGGSAMALDIEPGNVAPSRASSWVRGRHSAGERTPWLYADGSEMPEVEHLVLADDIKRDEFREWEAHYDGLAAIPAGRDAKQYEDHNEEYDRSICAGYLL